METLRDQLLNAGRQFSELSDARLRHPGAAALGPLRGAHFWTGTSKSLDIVSAAQRALRSGRSTIVSSTSARVGQHLGVREWASH